MKKYIAKFIVYIVFGLTVLQIILSNIPQIRSVSFIQNSFYQNWKMFTPSPEKNYYFIKYQCDNQNIQELKLFNYSYLGLERIFNIKKKDFYSYELITGLVRKTAKREKIKSLPEYLHLKSIIQEKCPANLALRAEIWERQIDLLAEKPLYAYNMKNDELQTIQ